ncbi:MAG: ATP-binding protein [Myxococcales bacterium]|nr:ATP-binding protein [Myxococcales bacterium]
MSCPSNPDLPCDVRNSLRGVLEVLSSAVASHAAADPDLSALGGWVIGSGEVSGLLADVAQGLSEDAGRLLPCVPPCEAGPLGHLCEAYEVGPVGHLALVLALGVELDAAFGRLVAYLNDHAAHVRPTVGLVWSLAGLGFGSQRLGVVQGALFEDGVLTMSGQGPLAAREIWLGEGLLARLTGQGSEARDHEVVPVGSPVLREEGLRHAVAQGQLPVLVVGEEGSGRERRAREVLAELGLSAVCGADPTWLRRESRLTGAGMLARVPADVSGSWWTGLWERGRPVVAVVAPAHLPAVRRQLPMEPVVVEVGGLDVSQRRALWDGSVLGPRLSEVLKDELAARFPFGPRQIERGAARALLHDAPEAHVVQVCQRMAARDLSAVAQRVRPGPGRSDLVLPEEVDRELDLLLGWVRHRSTVLGRWAMARHTGGRWGVCALFAGPAGTGKTMAAQVVAQQLQADLYRVDLSQVVSKYIGETEKHLDALMTGAQESAAILLFDEADALFGRRSEVRDARDRYANLEVGFLLQRIEAHDGVVLLSTNRMADMDEAFLRRFQFVLSFPKPSAELRRELWERLVPWEATTGDLDLDWLAERFEMTGGEIRNAGVAAGFLAAASGQPLDLGHLLQAARREVRKSGRFLRPAEREEPAMGTMSR